MNFNLRDSVILLVRAGSRSYGLHTAESDIDLKGICVPPAEFITGLEVFEQADKPDHFVQFKPLLTAEEQEIALSTKVEGSIYEFRKFAKLACECNPNILESLFCRKEDVLFSTEEGRLLRENKALFLSKKIKFTLSGYAIAQLKRIVHHRAWLLNPPTKLPVRADFGLPERTLIPADQIAAANAVIKKQLDSWEPDLSCVPDDSMRIQIMEKINTTMSEVLAGTTMAMEDERQRRWHAAVVATGLPENLIHQLERERQYQSQKSNWDSYVNWKNTRNPARAALEEKFGYDCKHGAHLVRLMRMAEEVLTTGQVNVWRGGIDRDELLFIRNGGWNFDRLQQFAADMDQKLEALYKENPAKLPHSADRNGVNKLLQQIYRSRQGYPIAKSDQS